VGFAILRVGFWYFVALCEFWVGCGFCFWFRFVVWCLILVVRCLWWVGSFRYLFGCCGFCACGVVCWIARGFFDFGFLWVCCLVLYFVCLGVFGLCLMFL